MIVKLIIWNRVTDTNYVGVIEGNEFVRFFISYGYPKLFWLTWNVNTFTTSSESLEELKNKAQESFNAFVKSMITE